jgi:hypothetical protein
MDIGCSSLPPKILAADKLMPDAQTLLYLAARGCHFVACALYVLVVSIEIFFLTVRDHVIARIVLYKI